MVLSIRCANQEDIVFITNLRNELRRYFLSSDPADAMTTKRMLNEDGTLFYIAEQGEKPIGCFSLEMKRNGMYDHAMFGHFMIMPRHQGQGIGEKVMEMAKDKARELGLKALYLSTLSDNVAALKVYFRTNFKTQQQVPATTEMVCQL